MLLDIRGSFTVVPPAPLGPQTGAFAATEEQLIDWAIEAEEGARCVYARVPSLRFHAGLRDRAAALAAAGALTLNNVRHAPGSDLFDFIARRSCLSLARPEPKPAPARTAGPVDPLTPEARRVLDHLARLADVGAPCSSNRMIARAAMLKDADAAAYQLRRLGALGFIVRTAVPVEPGRVITIVETGAKTGLLRGLGARG
ncbi:MAG: hypothetical protein ACK4K7_03145 [Allosphingosinicella sp.]|uniref:hypothetical protein n=1 Tax=Allosphingosinicella sp. TaxID=2823234 RepID=UPI00392F40F0